jgi:hypothetical protein
MAKLNGLCSSTILYLIVYSFKKGSFIMPKWYRLISTVCLVVVVVVFSTVLLLLLLKLLQIFKTVLKENSLT